MQQGMLVLDCGESQGFKREVSLVLTLSFSLAFHVDNSVRMVSC